MHAPIIAVANCGQLIIKLIFFSKINPVAKIKINFRKAADTDAIQKFLFLNLENTKTKIIFPIIINGITGASANDKSPVKREIMLGTRHKTKAVSTPKTITEIKSRAFTIDPVIS